MARHPPGSRRRSAPRLLSDQIRVFVNEQPLLVAAGVTVSDAVSALDPALASALADGRAYATDGVGRPVPGTQQVLPGAIFRVVVTARRS